jgi:CCR4-NOT transcription complex subunit 10
MAKTLKTSCPETLYNLAIMHLFTGNTKSAFDILYNLVPHFKSNPRLWLRLAECCLEERCKSSISDFDLAKNKQNLVKGYVGTGIHRKLILKGSADKTTDRETFLFARGCLMNSLTTINSPECSFYPSNQPSETELVRLRISICLSLSYVNLSLSDYVQGYRYAKGALNLSPSSYQAVLANLYAGEALIWLDQISDAITHFTPDLLGHEPVPGDDSPQPTLPPSVTSWYPATAKVVLLYNMAVAYTLRGELDKASDTLRQVGANVNSTDATVPVHVIMLAVYIQLQLGYIDIAKELLRKHLPQYR